jgi:hypothetical protein
MAKGIFTVSFSGQDKLRRNLISLRNRFPEFLADANQETADEIVREAQRNIKEQDAYTTGDLYGSIKVDVTARGMRITVGSTSHYAPYVEFGMRPHFPPLEPIRAWCRERGIDERAAFPIARAISERGTPERPFLYPAFLAGKRNHVARVKKLYSLGIRGFLE